MNAPELRVYTKPKKSEAPGVAKDEKAKRLRMEVEQTVLAGALLWGGEVSAHLQKVSEDSFQFEAHRLIFRAYRHVEERHREFDIGLVFQRLVLTDDIKSVPGDLSYLTRICKKAISPTTWSAHVGSLQQLCQADSVAAAALELAKKTADDPAETADALTHFFEKTQGVGEDEEAGPHRYFGNAETIYESMLDGGQALTGRGFSTGLVDVDNALGYVPPGSFVLLASHTHHGKSMLACNVAAHVANQGGRVLVVTTEYPKQGYFKRILAAIAEVPLECLMVPGEKLDEMPEPPSYKQRVEWCERSYAALQVLSQMRLTVFDRFRNFKEFEAAIDAEYRRAPFDLLVVDYPEQLNIGGQSAYERDQERMKRLRTLARTLPTTVFAVAQYNRQAKEGEEPCNYWLKGGGMMEQYASHILHIRRPQVDNHDFAEIWVTKNGDNPPRSAIEVGFQGKYARFVSLSRR